MTEQDKAALAAARVLKEYVKEVKCKECKLEFLCGIYLNHCPVRWPIDEQEVQP